MQMRWILMLALLASQAVAQDSVRFGKQSPSIGVVLDQSVVVGMSLKTRSLQDSQVIEQAEVESERRQRRIVTAEVVDSGRVVGAVVEFVASERSRGDVSAADPVVGKRYRCVREGEDLRITTLEGDVPPLDEYKVVAEAMESLGKPNALADFLAGKSVAVGDRLELPPDVAQQAIGFDRRMGQVERFVLVLKGVDSASSATFARFDAEIEASGAGSSQMRMMVFGEFVVDASTSRVASAVLSGPIGLSETRGSAGHKYQVAGTGKLRLELASREVRPSL